MFIAVINRSDDVTREEARLMTDACAMQLDRDVIPVWQGPPCTVRLYSPKAVLPKNTLAIVVRSEWRSEDDRENGYLGYHTQNQNGVRWGRVYTRPILDDRGTVLGGGNSVAVTLSHEVIESYVDPDMNLWAEGDRGTFWSYEACDPVESSSYFVRVRGRRIGVSNFVYPAWFDPVHLPRARFDHLGKIRGPFRVMGDGYAVYRQGKRTLTRWGSRYDAERKRETLAKKTLPLARTARRLR